MLEHIFLPNAIKARGVYAWRAARNLIFCIDTLRINQILRGIRIFITILRYPCISHEIVYKIRGR